MPAITATLIKNAGNTALTYVTLDGATDTFTADKSANQSLLVRNPTGGNITFTMIGDAAPATKECDGVGVVPITPESVTVNAGESVSVYLSVLRTKLAGVTTVTAGTGLEALIVNY